MVLKEEKVLEVLKEMVPDAEGMVKEVLKKDLVDTKIILKV
jgi:hypothetical protein